MILLFLNFKGILERFYNPKMEKILNLTGKFNLAWENQLRESTEGELKEAIDSIVANRNRIAHGKDVGISYVIIKKYYANAIKVVEMIENQIKP